MTYCATSQNAGSNLPYHAMTDCKDSFRAIAAALTAAGTADDYLPGDTVIVTIDGFTVTTQTPLAAAAKYTKAVRRAKAQPASRSRNRSKWSDKDEAHYIAVNGQETEAEAQYSIFEPTTPTKKDSTMEAVQARAAVGAQRATYDAETVKQAKEQQIAATLADADNELLTALQAELAQPAAKPAPIAQVKPAPIAQVKPAAKKPAKKPAAKKPAIAALATMYDYSPAETCQTITDLSAIYNQQPSANPLSALAAVYDVTSESTERVTLANLSDLYTTQSTPATPVTEPMEPLLYAAPVSAAPATTRKRLPWKKIGGTLTAAFAILVFLA